uniref:Nodulin-like domain-containing protein n=1 Tax=Cucumis melo TaxID=3656 RepID=A0A9I9EAF5_CUCME
MATSGNPFWYHLLFGRWFSVFASILIMSVSGATYMFGLYSSHIKSSLAYDQTTLNLLSFFKDLGANIGVISGLVNEVAPAWVVLLIGVVMNLFGYTMIWLAVTNRIPNPQIWHMCLYICIGANSQTFANTAALITCVKNFPESRGSILGLFKGFVGLSGAILSQLFHAFYGNNSKSLIFLIAWLPSAVSVILHRFVRIIKDLRQPNELKVFYHVLYISLGLAGSLMVCIILQNRLRFQQIHYVGSAIVVIVLLLLPLAIVFREELRIWRSKIKNPIPQLELASQLPPPPPPNPPSDSCFKNMFNPPNRGEDYTIPQAIFSIDMIILFIATICGVERQMEAAGRLRKEGEDLSCLGVECYKKAFLIITGSTVLGGLVSLILVVRTWKFYKDDIYRRFKEKEGEDIEIKIAAPTNNSLTAAKTVSA